MTGDVETHDETQAVRRLRHVGDVHDVSCSCGRSWTDVTRAQASELATRHDDAPEDAHILSSPTAFSPGPRRAPRPHGGR